jgi:predicted small metal-binding protein
VIDCDCGVTLQAANDDELTERVREHTGESHPEMEMSEDELREFVEGKAYSAMDS